MHLSNVNCKYKSGGKFHQCMILIQYFYVSPDPQTEMLALSFEISVQPFYQSMQFFVDMFCGFVDAFERSIYPIQYSGMQMI